MLMLSLDVGGAAGAALWTEVEDRLGRSEDPLELLIREEEAHAGTGGELLNDIDEED